MILNKIHIILHVYNDLYIQFFHQSNKNFTNKTMNYNPLIQKKKLTFFN